MPNLPCSVKLEIISEGHDQGSYIQGPCQYKQTFISNKNFKKELKKILSENKFEGILQKFVLPSENHNCKRK